MAAIRALLPATAAEVAAVIGISNQQALRLLIGIKRNKRPGYSIRRTDQRAPMYRGKRGQAPFIWERVPAEGFGDMGISAR